MQPKQKITIISSPELLEIRLKELIGRTAILIEEDLLPRHLGWWVELTDEGYLGEKEWFIPLSSIQQ